MPSNWGREGHCVGYTKGLCWNARHLGQQAVGVGFPTHVELDGNSHCISAFVEGMLLATNKPMALALKILGFRPMDI